MGALDDLGLDPDIFEKARRAGMDAVGPGAYALDRGTRALDDANPEDAAPDFDEASRSKMPEISSAGGRMRDVASKYLGEKPGSAGARSGPLGMLQQMTGGAALNPGASRMTPEARAFAAQRLGASPRGFGPDLDSAALARAQEADKHDADMNELAQNMSSAGSLIRGAGGKSTIMADKGGEAAANLTARRGAFAQDRAAEAAAKRAAMDADPGSVLSQAKLALARKYGLPVPEGSSGMDVEEALPLGEKTYAIDEKSKDRSEGRADRKAQMDAAMREKESESQKQRDFLAAEHQRDRENRRDLAKEHEDAKAKGKGGLPDLGPEYEVTRPIDKKDISEFTKKRAGSDAFNRQLDDYENLLKQHEGSRLTGDLSGRIQAAHADLLQAWLDAKGRNRLTDNETKLFNGALPNMAGMGGLLKRDETAFGATSQLRHNADTDLGAHERALGLKRKGATGGDATLKAGEILMLDPKGKPHAVSADEADEALKHGWKKG